jgi:uncharacterized protein (TIGR02099 family)
MGKILLYTFAGLVFVVLLLMLAVKIALDRAPHYQAQIKEWVHAQTGYHIGFTSVSPAFRWYGPELYFDQMELRSKDDQRVLAHAAGGRIGLDIWQLISSGKLLAGRVEVDAPNIEITRLGPSRFAVASEIELDAESSSNRPFRVDDLPAGRLVIRHAVFTLQKWNEALPELILHEVNLDIRRGDHGLALGFNAVLPPVLGGSVSFRASVDGRAELQTLRWNGVAQLSGISFPGWHQLLPDYLSNLESGSGAFEIAAGGQGQELARATLKFDANGVIMQLIDGPVTKFDHMSGALALSHSGDRWNLTGKQVRVARNDAESNFDVSWQSSDAGLLNLSARASYLRAETLLPLTGFLPQKNIRDHLREIAPTGEWTDSLVALARNTVSDPWRLQVQAKFQRAGFAPVGAAPGIRGLSGSIGGNESGGHVYFDSPTAVFSWPAQFSQPVELQPFQSNLFWKRDAKELLVATPGFEAKTRDFELHGQGSWQQPNDGGSPVLTLLSNIQNGKVASARNYLPKGLIAPTAFAWLDAALVAGRMSRASVVFQGPVQRFPFRDGSGLFLARCAIEDMTLNYGEGWAPVEDLTVEAEFRNTGMSARLIKGHIGDVLLDSGEARFPDFSNGELRIHALAHGDAGGALAFLRATPLNAASESAFSGVEASGALQTTIDLFFPFKNFVNRQVLVHARLDGVALNRPGSNTKATEVTGDADIDGGQVARADVHGQILGGPFVMQARSARNKPVTRTQLDFKGTMSAAPLLTALSLPTALMSGQTDWHAVLKLTPEPARERWLHVTSNLVGLQLKLPAPLAKPAATALASFFDIQWPAQGGPQGKVGLGSLLNSTYELETVAEGTRLAHVSIMFGEAEPAGGESQIFNVGGSVARLDLAGWLALSAPDSNAKPLVYYMRAARLDVAELDYLGLAFRDISLDLAVTEGSLRISVGGPNVIGAITVPSASGSTEPWNLQFDRLRFEVADTDAPADAAAPEPPPAPDAKSAVNPRAIPALNFHATELIWGERQLGDVTATLIKVDDGVSLKQLTVVGNNFNVSARGDWRGKDAGICHLDGTLNSTDVQGTLKDLGYADIIQAKTGKVDFKLSWLGAPTGDALVQVAGHVQASLEKGQITGLKPGAGRVLGLASLSALRRRLELDFSDLTDKGLAFDTVRGDFDLHDGNAYTDNLLLKGPAAEIGLIGRVGLKNRDYDQTAVVTGNVNSLSIPVASALVGGPVVGAAVLLFTQVFKQPLKGLARGYYRITGSWDNPTVERIKSADAAAATAEAPK